MFTIILQNQHVKSPVGWHQEERTKRVDLYISVRAQLKAVQLYDDLHKTLDYSDLIKVVITEASKERRLLETLAVDIAEAIQRDYVQTLKNLFIEIRKTQIPVPGFQGDFAGIQYEVSY